MTSTTYRSSLDVFQEIGRKEGQRLEEVWQRVEDGSRDLLVLQFSAGALAVAVDADTDTVEARYEEAEAFNSSGLIRAGTFAPWASLIGQTFGWGGVVINQQGYQDGVLLSFGGLQPSVLLVAAASSLRVYSMSEATNGTVP